MKINIDWRIFNPVAYHLWKWILDPDIRFILVYGGSGAAKTYSILQIIHILQLNSRYNCAVVRKQENRIAETVFADAAKIANGFNNSLRHKFFTQTAKPLRIRSDDSKTIFFGVADVEQLKGLADIHALVMNELNLFKLGDLQEVQRRLRGMYNQKIIADWNPVDENSWVKKQFIDLEQWTDLPLDVDNNPLSRLDDSSAVKINDRKDMILIRTTYLDNRWITGSDHEGYGMRDIHQMRNFELLRERDPMQYAVYALGEWGVFRIENVFWYAFSPKLHVRSDIDRIDENIHVTIDINRLPYITQCLWIFKKNEKEFVQFKELLAKSPNNEAELAADMLGNYLTSIHYDGVIMLYGDASGNNRDARDGKSFFSMYINRLAKHVGHARIHDNILKKNPSVSTSAAFINGIYSGNTPYKIVINSQCNESIIDYQIAEKDSDGNMLKKKDKNGIEQSGHISDSKRYFLVKFLAPEYDMFKKSKPMDRILN